MKRVSTLRIPFQKDPDLQALVARQLGITPAEIATVRVVKRSLDARNRRQFYWVYTVDVFFHGDAVEQAFAPFPQLRWDGPPPLILGAGPAGLFAAWTLLQHGIRPLLLERGERTHERMKKISRYWRHGELDADSNVCNGEGGAGTFSDGKLITRIKSPYIARIMQALVDYGAPPEITYVYNPHVGSNRIREVIRRMSDDLIRRGGDFRFQTRVERLDLKGNTVQGVYLPNDERIAGTGLILACGHSAGPFFHTLREQGVRFEPKSFALGLRIEHPQAYINRWQYGDALTSEHSEREGGTQQALPVGGATRAPVLDAAQYKLTSHWDRESVGVYTFCMCPGGYVISSTTDPETIVVNGMSNYHRNSPWANAAVVCSVAQERIPGDDPFKMMGFQRAIEHAVYDASRRAGSTHRIPAQHLDDFLAGRSGPITATSSCPSGVIKANLATILPPWIYEHLCKGMMQFDRKRKGFAHPQALLHAVESRTSSPVRIPRDPDTLESVSTPGLFPCGEGPGYAGGITSAAVDGIRAALAWIRKFTPPA